MSEKEVKSWRERNSTKDLSKSRLPKYIKCRHPFGGVWASNETLGYITPELTIDNQSFNDIFFIIKNKKKNPGSHNWIKSIKPNGSHNFTKKNTVNCLTKRKFN